MQITCNLKHAGATHETPLESISQSVVSTWPVAAYLKLYTVHRKWCNAEPTTLAGP